MPIRRSRRTTVTSPLGVLAMVLLIVFVIEGAIMMALPSIRVWEPGSIMDSLVDATLLSALITPALWYLIVRPLRLLFHQRGVLLARVFHAQEEERARLGRDLHDQLGQNLTAILVGLRAMEQSAGPGALREHAGSLLGLAATSLDEVRRMSRGLRPSVLEDFGLATAIGRLAEDFRIAHNIPCVVAVQLREGERFGGPVEITAYRIVQESLTNIARHARASSARVSLARNGGVLELVIEDDGLGIANVQGARQPSASAAAAPPDGVERSDSFGLRSMRERAELLSGSLAVDSGATGGTRILARIPLGKSLGSP